MIRFRFITILFAALLLLPAAGCGDGTSRRDGDNPQGGGNLTPDAAEARYRDLLSFYRDAHRRDSVLSARTRDDIRSTDVYDSLALAACFMETGEPADARRYIPASDRDLSGYLLKKEWLNLNARLSRAENDYQTESWYLVKGDSLEETYRQTTGTSYLKIVHNLHDAECKSDPRPSRAGRDTVIAGMAILMTLIIPIFLKRYRHRFHSGRHGRIPIPSADEIVHARIEWIRQELERKETQLNDAVSREREVEKALQEHREAISRRNQTDSDTPAPPDITDDIIEQLTKETEELHEARQSASDRALLCKQMLMATTAENFSIRELASEIDDLIRNANGAISLTMDALRGDAPEVYRRLCAYGLSIKEIEVCALLRFGLKTKDIQTLLPGMHNKNFTSRIREKLQLKKNAPYLRNILLSDTLDKYIPPTPD